MFREREAPSGVLPSQQEGLDDVGHISVLDPSARPALWSGETEGPHGCGELQCSLQDVQPGVDQARVSTTKCNRSPSADGPGHNSVH